MLALQSNYIPGPVDVELSSRKA
jgi:hypothetical protein